MIGHSQDDEIERALSELTEEQEDELDDALREDENRGFWSNRRCLRWMWQEAIRRGWLLGPA
jgi:hypothetical protein